MKWQGGRDAPWTRVERIIQDLRYAASSLSRSPSFTVTVVITIALTLAPLMAVFAVVNGVLLKPLPYRDVDRLVIVGAEGSVRPTFDVVDAMRRGSQTLDDAAFFDPASATRTDGDEAERISVVRASANVLSVLGLAPAAGRGFSDVEAAGRAPVALVSYQFWRSRMAGVDVTGRSIVIDGLPLQIVGVLPEALSIPALNADVWQPYSHSGPARWFVLGRMKPGRTPEHVRQELTSLAQHLATVAPETAAAVTSLPLYLVDARSRLALWLLFGVGCAVLLLALANVASVTLARSSERANEIFTRTALGAGAARLVEQFLTEHVGVAVVAGGLALPVAIGLVYLLQQFGTGVAREASVGANVILLAAVASAAMGTLMALVASARLILGGSSAANGRGVAGSRGARRARRVLVTGEFALALLLVTTAGGLARAWWQVSHVGLGFRAERLLSVQLATPADMSAAERSVVYDQLLERVGALPGVERASIVGDLFVGAGAERAVSLEAGSPVMARVDEASAGFFKTIGAELTTGRSFDAVPPSPAPIAIVNETFASRAWPGGDAVGQRIRLGPGWATVIGVVADMRRQGPAVAPNAQVFEPLWQNPSRLETLIVRTASADQRAMIPALQSAVRGVDKRVPMYQFTTVADRLAGYTAAQRFQMLLVVGFSGIALLLSAVGVYGLTHHSVVARTREFAIRMALGATSSSIVRLVLREGMASSAIGIAIGAGLSLAAARLGASLLTGDLHPSAALLLAACSVLAATAWFACVLPARRSIRVSPAQALGDD